MKRSGFFIQDKTFRPSFLFLSRDVIHCCYHQQLLWIPSSQTPEPLQPRPMDLTTAFPFAGLAIRGAKYNTSVPSVEQPPAPAAIDKKPSF